MNNKYLKTIWALFKKELMSYFNSPIAYIFIAVFLVVGNWLFFYSFFVSQQASMRNYFNLLPWIFLFLSPALTMRLWSEEKRSGTIEFLLTLPITDWQAVLGKFLGSLAFLTISLLFTLTIPITIMSLGNVDLGPIIGGYLGSILMGAVYLSLGGFISSLTKNQIIAFIGAVVIAFIFFIWSFATWTSKGLSYPPNFLLTSILIFVLLLSISVRWMSMYTPNDKNSVF